MRIFVDSLYYSAQSFKPSKKTGILDYENDRIQQVNHYRLNTEIPVKFARRSGKGAQHERNMSAKRAKGERKTSEG